MAKKVYKVHRPMYLFYIECDKIIKKECHMVLRQIYTKSKHGNPFYYFLDKDFHSDEEIADYKHLFVARPPKENIGLDTVCPVAFNRNMLSFSDSDIDYRLKVIDVLNSLCELGTHLLTNPEGIKKQTNEDITNVLLYEVVNA